LTRRAHAHDPLSGYGSARAGSRWNSAGVRVAYTSTSRPLAVLEMLLHVTRETIPVDPVLIPMEVPDSLLAEMPSLPKDWNALPFSASARAAGDRWVREAGSAGLLVPSVVLPMERNLLINPLHPEARRIRVLAPEAVTFDRRLLR